MTKGKEDLVEHVNPETGEITQVTAAEHQALVAQEDLAGYAADTGGGFENTTQDDWAIPFIIVLQSNSPEVAKEGSTLRGGTIFNRTTEETWLSKEGLDFVPALTEHKMVEWIPRNPDGSGGGFVASHDIDSELAKTVKATQPLGKYKHPGNGNDLLETYYVYGIVVNRENGSYYPACIPFASTFIKPYQSFVFKARSVMITIPNTTRRINPPLFAHVYTMRTEQQKKGTNTWYTPTITYAGESADKCRLSPNSELYRAAKDFKEAVLAGQVKLDAENLKNDTVREDAAPQRGDTEAADAPY